MKRKVSKVPMDHKKLNHNKLTTYRRRSTLTTATNPSCSNLSFPSLVKTKLRTAPMILARSSHPLKRRQMSNWSQLTASLFRRRRSQCSRARHRSALT